MKKFSTILFSIFAASLLWGCTALQQLLPSVPAPTPSPVVVTIKIRVTPSPKPTITVICDCCECVIGDDQSPQPDETPIPRIVEVRTAVEMPFKEATSEQPEIIFGRWDLRADARTWMVWADEVIIRATIDGGESDYEIASVSAYVDGIPL